MPKSQQTSDPPGSEPDRSVFVVALKRGCDARCVPLVAKALVTAGLDVKPGPNPKRMVVSGAASNLEIEELLGDDAKQFHIEGIVQHHSSSPRLGPGSSSRR